MKYFEKIELLAKKKNSLLCVGLDPREESVETVFDRNKLIIDQTINYTICYKPNIAFYEAYGPQGFEMLSKTIEYIGDEVPILLDAKRNDIGATAEAYAQSAYQHFGVDAITLNPYMGKSSADPFLNYEDNGIFFLCRTSNPGADSIQELNIDGTSLYLKIADEALSWRDNCGLVVAGNNYEALRAVRKRHPNAWFLSPGIGAQGGDMTKAINAGLREDGLGIMPVVVRGIANAENPGKAAKDYVTALNAARDTYKPIYSNGFSNAKEELFKGLVDTQCFKTGSFILKSGIESPFYIDLRRISSSSNFLKIVAKAYASLIDTSKYDSVAGIPVAALPLATAVSLETGLPLIYPRIAKKAHGTGNKIEGEWKEGDRVLLLDDLITTGKSKIEAIDILRGAGLIVEDLVVLIERGSQGREDMISHKINLMAYAHADEMFEFYHEENLITDNMYNKIIQFIKEN